MRESEKFRMRIMKNCLFRAKDWRMDLLGSKYGTMFYENRNL